MPMSVYVGKHFNRARLELTFKWEQLGMTAAHQQDSSSTATATATATAAEEVEEEQQQQQKKCSKNIEVFGI